MSNLFSHLIRPIVTEYFDWDEGSVEEDTLWYAGAILRKKLGPFEKGDDFGGVTFNLVEDGNVEVYAEIHRWIRPENRGRYANYWITNPILTELDPEEYPYVKTYNAEYTHDNPWADFDLTPYLPIRLIAVVGDVKR